MLDDPMFDSYVGQEILVWFLCGARDFTFLRSVQTTCGAHSSSCSVGTTAFPQRLNWLKCEAEYLSPSNSKFNNDWR